MSSTGRPGVDSERVDTLDAFLASKSDAIRGNPGVTRILPEPRVSAFTSGSVLEPKHYVLGGKRFQQCLLRFAVPTHVYLQKAKFVPLLGALSAWFSTRDLRTKRAALAVQLNELVASPGPGGRGGVAQLRQ